MVSRNQGQNRCVESVYEQVGHFLGAVNMPAACKTVLDALLKGIIRLGAPLTDRSAMEAEM